MACGKPVAVNGCLKYKLNKNLFYILLVKFIHKNNTLNSL